MGNYPCCHGWDSDGIGCQRYWYWYWYGIMWLILVLVWYNVIDIGIDVIGCWQTQWLRHRTWGHFRAPLWPAHFEHCVVQCGETLWGHMWNRNTHFHTSMQALWGHMWKHTLEKNQDRGSLQGSLGGSSPLWTLCSAVWRNTLSQTNRASVTMHPSMQALWGHMWKHTLEKNQD